MKIATKKETKINYDKEKYKNLKIKKSNRPLQIAVLGSSDAICSIKGYNMAFEVGEAIAKAKAITLTGGGLGVMEAALKGAKKQKGVTLAIVPWESMNKVNDYADIVVATGIGWSRNSINLNSCDGAIIVQGGAGTLNEATYGYMMGKPIVALTPSGGMAEEISNRYFDERRTEFVYGANTPKDAVKKIFELIKIKKAKGEHLSELDKDLLAKEEKDDWRVIIKDTKKQLKKEKEKTKKKTKNKPKKTKAQAQKYKPRKNNNNKSKINNKANNTKNKKSIKHSFE
jgi:uncharacterized protein (TIGR00725 family)